MLGPDGTPLARQYICPKDEEVLSGDDIERGFEIAKGKFVIVTDEELEELAPRRSRDIALERFVPREEIDPAYFVRSYFLIPDEEQTKAYRLLAETMAETGRAALGSFVMRDKAYAVAIFSDQGILRAETLRFEDEVRSPEDLGLPKPKVVAKKVKEMVKLVTRLSESKLDESELRDDSTERLLALARRKHSRGEDVVEAPEEAGDEEQDGVNVVDLMALLKSRMRGNGNGGKAPASGNTRSRSAASRGTRTATKSSPKTSGARVRSSQSLESASKQDLYELAQQLDIPGRSAMNRDQLLKSVRKAS